MQATLLWSLWQAILLPIAVGFTRRGQQRFVEWVTGLAPDRLAGRNHCLSRTIARRSGNPSLPVAYGRYTEQ